MSELEAAYKSLKEARQLALRVTQENARLRTELEAAKGDAVGEVERLRVWNERLRLVVQHHHDWHLAQEEDADGVGGAAAYVESGLCDRTLSALTADKSEAEAPAAARMFAEATWGENWTANEWNGLLAFAAMVRFTSETHPDLPEGADKSEAEVRQQEQIREDLRDRLLAKSYAIALNSYSEPERMEQRIVMGWLQDEGAVLPDDRARSRAQGGMDKGVDGSIVQKTKMPPTHPNVGGTSSEGFT